MFCPNCGSVLPDDAKFCNACGTVIAQADEASVKTPDENLSQQENQNNDINVQSVPLASEADEPNYEAEQPVQENYSVAQQPEENHVKSKKKMTVALLIAAGVIAAALLVSLLFGKRIVNSVKLVVLNPTQYYASVDYKNIENLLNGVEENTVDPSNFKTEAGVSLEITEEAKKLIEDISGEEINFNDTAINLKTDVNVNDNKYKIDLGLDINETDIVSAEVIYDIANEKVYGKVPLLSDNYFVSYESVKEMIVLDNDMKEDLVKFVRKYSKVILDNCFVFEKSKDELTVDGVTAQYTLLKADVSTKDLADVFIATLNELKDDEEAKEFITKDLIAEFGKAYGMDDDEIDEAIKGYEDGIDELIESLEDVEDRDLFEYSVWVDAEGQIVAREVKAEDVTVGYYNVRSGGKQGTDIIVKEGSNKLFELSGMAKRVGDDLTNGEYTVEVSGKKIAEITLDKYNLEKPKEGLFEAKFSVKLADDAVNMLPVEAKSIVKAFSLDFDINSAKNDSAVGLTLNSNDEKLAKISLTSKQVNSENISVPESAVDAEDYADNLNDPDDILDTLKQNLKKAGISEDLINSIESLFASNDDYYNDYYDDDYDYDYDYDYYDDDYSYSDIYELY